MYWRRLRASLLASHVGNTPRHYKLNNIYSRNLTATSRSFYLCSKVKYNILMLPILVKSFKKYLSVIGCFRPIGQAIPLGNNPVSKVKLTHVIFKATLLESYIISPSFMCIRCYRCWCYCTIILSICLKCKLLCFQATGYT